MIIILRLNLRNNFGDSFLLGLTLTKLYLASSMIPVNTKLFKSPNIFAGLRSGSSFNKPLRVHGNTRVSQDSCHPRLDFLNILYYLRMGQNGPYFGLLPCVCLCRSRHKKLMSCSKWYQRHLEAVDVLI